MMSTRMKLAAVVAVVWVVLLTTACGSDNSQLQEQFPTELDVQFSVEPQSPVVGETADLVALIEGLQPDEKVQVDFEIKQAEPDEREVIRAEQPEAGRFVVNKVFSEAGSYQVIVHIYTTQLHQMASGEVTVSE